MSYLYLYGERTIVNTMKEGEDNISDDDEVSFNKKRTREEKEAEDRVRLIVISLNFSSSYHLLND